jgi:uncharacterized membrane protein
MSSLGLFHTLCAVVALASGAAVLLRRKGTRWHRRAGWVYVASMLLLNISALLIYRLFGRFGPFHLAAIVSLLTVLAGTVVAVRRRPAGRWIEAHYYWMTFSYMGLVAAAFAEVSTRVPRAPFWPAVGVASFAIFGMGYWMIKRRASATLRPFALRMEREASPREVERRAAG